MNSKHKFYCQHKNTDDKHNELVEVKLKSNNTILVKYKDTDFNQTLKAALHKEDVHKLIAILDGACEGDKDYTSIVIHTSTYDLYVENISCADSRHHIFSFENENEYESVHLSTLDARLMSIVLANLVKRM